MAQNEIQKLITEDPRFRKMFSGRNVDFSLCVSQAFSLLLSLREKTDPIKLNVSCNRCKDEGMFSFDGESYLQYFYLEYWKDDELVAVATLGLKNHTHDDYGEFEDCHLIGVYYHLPSELKIFDGFSRADDWQAQLRYFNDTVISHSNL